MNKKLCLAVLLALIGSGAYAQKTATVRKCGGETITGIVADARFAIEIRQGDACGVELDVDDRLAPYLVCEVSDAGRLTLGYTKVPSLRWKGSAEPDESERKYVAEGNVDSRGGRMYRRGRAVVTVKTLRSLTVEPGAEVRSVGVIETDTLRLDLDGLRKPKNVRLDLDAGYLDLRGVGTKGLRLAGSVSEMWVRLEDSELDFPELKLGKVAGTMKNSTLRCTATEAGDLSCMNSRYIRIR